MQNTNFLRQFFTTPTSKYAHKATIFWFTLSLTFAAVYASLGLREVFENTYVIQDDARQHVFWMQRFLDAEMFPQDLMADYFQSVAPTGYTTLYQLIARMGIDPFLLNKILPLLLGFMTTGYCFGVSMQLLPVPFTGFIASLLLNQNLWMQDDVPSATPVAFVYPLFLAFLYYLLKRKLILTCVAIALLGLFYPQCVFLASGILVLQLLCWKNKQLSFSQSRQDYLFCAIGLGVAFFVMLPYALKSSEFGPVLTATEAKILWPSFFINNPVKYWLCWRRTGIFPSEWCELSFSLPQIFLGLLLLLFLQFPSQFTLQKNITQKISIIPQILVVSVAMFFAAHLLLFKLHLPNRYTEHSFRILMPLAGAIAFTLLLDAILKPETRLRVLSAALAKKGVAFFLLALLIFYPALVRKFPDVDYKVGQFPQVYEFLAQQPKDTLIASIAEETDNLPSFSKRSILVSPTYVVGYHKTYYLKLRERAIDLIEAQYSPNLERVQEFIQKYGIDLWLIERSAFSSEYLEKSPWLRRFQLTETQPLFIAAEEAKSQLDRGTIPAIARLLDTCSVFESDRFIILQANCVTKSP